MSPKFKNQWGKSWHGLPLVKNKMTLFTVMRNLQCTKYVGNMTQVSVSSSNWIFFFNSEVLI